MKPSRNPSWRVVIQRLARAIDGLAESAARRHDLVEQVRLELADERREGPGVGPDPAGPIHDLGPLHDAGQLGAERGRTAPARSAPWPPRTSGSVARSSAAVRLPGARARRRDRRSARRPASRRDPGARPRSARRPATVAADPQGGPDEEPGLPDAIVAPRAASPDAASVIAPARRGSIRSRHPGRRTRTAGRRATWKAAGVTGRELAMGRGRRPLVGPVVACRARIGGRAAGRAGRLHAVHAEQLGQRGGRGRRGVDDRDPVAHRRRDERPQQRVVGAAQQQRIDGRAGRLREDGLAGRVRSAEQRRERIGDGRLGDRDPSGRRTPRAARAPASRARTPRPPGFSSLMASKYACDRIVAGVAMTPTRRTRVARAAADAPARMTPRTGRS